MTFSILVREGREFGIGVVSGSVGVGKRVPWVQRGVGAVATQGFTEISYGPRILDLLRGGLNPAQSLELVLSDDSLKEFRQVLVLAAGGAAVHTGKSCPSFCGHIVKENLVCGGNLLAGRKVLEAMVEEFTGESMPLKILNSLMAGARAGGDRRGQKSAAIVVTGPLPLRVEVDNSEDPLTELKRKLEQTKHTD